MTDVAHAIQTAAAHREAGRLPDAEQVCRQILQADPDNAQALSFLGVNLADAYYRLGNSSMALGRLADAEASFGHALRLRPGFPECHNNRAIALAELGRLEEAERSYRAALALKPDHAKACNNLANLLRTTGRHAEAEQCYRHAIALQPDLAEAYGHLGNSLLDLGRLAEAEPIYRRALALNPGMALAHSNLLLYLNYVPRRRPSDLLAEHLEFARRFCPSAGPVSHANVPDPERRLRIGYVSGDLRDHSVAFFIEPVLAHHDRRAFEIFCYYNFARADAVTQRLKSHANHWRDVHALGDEALARLVRDDAIDILVDLSGHTAHNRLTAFGLKPAPVQVSYLGYPATTGLAAMDYRLTDSIVDPAGEGDRWFTERLIRLPDAMWCFRPDDALPAVGPAPVLASGKVTFGSFNYYAKLNPEVIALWAGLLARLPDSRLIVTRVPGQQAERALRNRFVAAGVAPERVELHGIVSREQLGALFARTDIALDPFPYGGTTTTCEVLWMGIPLVTLAGEVTASRSGASLLGAVGLDALVARSSGRYLEIAVELAHDPGRIAAMRASLRDRMQASPLMDAARFVCNLEEAYRSMWQAWCGTPRP